MRGSFEHELTIYVAGLAVEHMPRRARTFTVGVGTHFRPTRLNDLLESLHAQTRHPDELIVVHSDDEPTIDVLRDHQERFSRDGVDLRRYARRSDTELVQEIRNRILDLATGDVVCFLDDDTVCSREWFESVRRTYENDRTVVAVGGPAIRSDPALEPSDELIRSQEPQNEITRHGDVIDLSGRWVPPSPVEAPVCRGANMSFRSDFLEAIDGFDAGYGGMGAFEEWDAMAKLRERGETLVYHPEALVYHIEEESGGTRREQESTWSGVHWYARNSVRFRRKHASTTFTRSVFHLVADGGALPPLWHRLLLLLSGDRSQFHWLRGYAGGVVDSFRK